MSRKTSTPTPARELDRVPDRIELRCLPGRIALEALAVEGEVDAVPRFTMVAYTGEPLRVEGWRFPVVVDLEGLSIPSQRRPVRFGHSMYAGVGHTERIAVEAGRLIAEGIVSRDTAAAREVVASGKRGFPWQASIGAQVAQAEFIRAGKSATVNGRTFEGPLYVARRTVLGEISFVDLGADGNTTATIAAQQENEPMNETQDTEVRGTEAQDAPQTGVAHDEAEGAGTEAGPAANPAPPAVNPVAEIRAQALAETKRIAAIRTVCNGRFPEIEARAIAEGWTRDKTELAVLRESRPKAPAVHVTELVVTDRVLEAACLQAAKVEKPERYYDAPTLEEAHRQFDGRLGLAELIIEAARANGYVGRERRVTPEMLRYAFGREIRAAASTIDIGGILSNVANKFLLEGFFGVERTWRNLCAVRNVSDFKTVTSYRLIGKDQYEQVAPGGELKHGTLGEQAYTNKADTYGLLLSIDRRDIINDDLGAITTVPRKLGRGSGLKINDIFWSIFMNNAAFFSSGNSNYLTGADTALSIEGLSKAEKAFLDQTDPDGKPLGAMPAVVLVPTALSAMATVLYKSLEIRDTTASTRYPVANPHTAQRGPYAHGTELRWYVRYFYNDPDPQDPDITKYDPGSDSVPADADAYYLQWFAHFNPYAYGLPEMLEDYGGINVRHGTDFFQCDGGETIQPALINMVRFVLSWLGGDCCTGEYDTCAETDDRCDAFHHNPRFRGGDDGLCCVPMPIKFRWSGSNVHPHYMTGGKGLVGGATPDPRPLHNHPNHVPGQGETWGSAAARKTWRGINLLYADDLHFNNPYYGGGYSWGTAPGTFVLMYEPAWDDFAKVWAKYPSWGLRPGDVIEAVHIQEIIDAVDYLIDYGVWTSIGLCTRKRTPGQFMGKDCGYHYAADYHDCYGTAHVEYRKGCDKCCANAEACWPYDHALGYWYHQWGPDYDDQWTEYPDTCQSWPVPTWQECTQNCQSAKCHMMSRKHGYSQYSPETSPDCPCERGYWEDTVCDGYGDDMEASPGCGYHRNEKGCRSWDWQTQRCVDDPHAGYNCLRRVEGYSYYACTPDTCNHGWDATHGGQFKKNRLDHVWHPGLYFKATGPPGNEFSGNCLGDMFGCGETYPMGPDTLFVVEGPFDALMVTAAIQPDNNSVATAFFGSLPTDAQLALVVAAVPFYRMVYMMLDANVWGRCRRLAREVAKLAGVPNVGAINIGFENRDPGATRVEELQRLVAYASASWAPEIHWMWERRLVVGGAKGA